MFITLSYDFKQLKICNCFETQATPRLLLGTIYGLFRQLIRLDDGFEKLTVSH